MDTLTVVNTMLGTLGEVPLNSLTDSHSMLGAALDKLDNASRRIQSKSWWYNTDRPTLQPSNIDGSIYLPNDCLSVRTSDPDVVARGNRLYNVADGTFVFTREQTVRLIRKIDFQDLPEVMASYIAAEAVMDFQLQYDADNSKTRQLEQRLSEARMEVNSEETRQRGANLLESNSRLQRLKYLTRNARSHIRS